MAGIVVQPHARGTVIAQSGVALMNRFVSVGVRYSPENNRVFSVTGDSMSKRERGPQGRPSGLSIASFFLGLVLLGVTGIVAALWNPIDEAIINRADSAGWDTTMLLPNQTALWLVVNASVVVALALVVVSFFAMWASRRVVPEDYLLPKLPPSS